MFKRTEWHSVAVCECGRSYDMGQCESRHLAFGFTRYCECGNNIGSQGRHVKIEKRKREVFDHWPILIGCGIVVFATIVLVLMISSIISRFG